HQIAIIDGDMRIAGYLHGTAFEERDIRLALTAAWVGDSLVQKYRNWIAGVAGVSALMTALVVFITGRRRTRAQAT
ncbi:MAG: hypothetical protein IH969_00245, partial [Candidatus Krumholzibacteriota bacterium]|nr:hypothetical protein [Candidatus Krumholzibacteriota bacterium]